MTGPDEGHAPLLGLSLYPEESTLPKSAFQERATYENVGSTSQAVVSSASTR